tara:strand:+ start:1824 stop:2375 length:552 start_codon:yes stop_codon:yes gene_type:complete
MATNENSIDHFKNTFLKNGIARPTMYSVELTGPLETLSFQPESLTLPSRQFHVTEDDLSFGPSRKVPIGRTYTDEIVLQFPVDDKQGERTFFEAWMDKIVHPTTQMATYLDGSGSIAGSMVIKTLSATGKVSSQYEFEECYPASIMPVTLAYGNRDSYMQLQVSMVFRSYKYISDSYETPSAF